MLDRPWRIGCVAAAGLALCAGAGLALCAGCDAISTSPRVDGGPGASDAGRHDAAPDAATRDTAGADLGADLGVDLDADLGADAGADAQPPDLVATPDAACPGAQLLVDGTCRQCDVVVPKDQPSIIKAVAAAPAPGTVCVLSGTHKGDLTLRPGVAVHGAGKAVVIEGRLVVTKLGAPKPVDTVVSGLTISFGYLAAVTSCPLSTTNCTINNQLDNAGKTLSLTLERITFEGQAGGTTYCANLVISRGDLQLTLQDSLCRSERGFRVLHFTNSEKVKTDVAIRRNRFEPQASLSWTYNPVTVSFYGKGSTSEVPAAAGTRVNARVENNELLQTHYQAIYVVQGLNLLPADRPLSRIVVANNTFVSKDGKYGIWNNSVAGRWPALVVANNLFHNCAEQVHGKAADVAVANLASAAADHVSLAKGDLRLVKGSKAIDAASAAYAPKDDKGGQARPVDGDGDGKSLPDVGAHEYVPVAIP